MQIDGKTVYPYLVLLNDGLPVFGFDTRPLADVTKAWLAAWSATAKKSAEHNKIAVRANILNQATSKKAEEYGSDHDDLRFEGPPVCAPGPEEVFVLNGIPWRDDYGALAVIADVVKGVAYVDHEDLVGFRRKNPINAVPATISKDPTT